MATLRSLLRRASIYLNITNNERHHNSLSNGEIVFSKNNVCVHSMDKERCETNHKFGYLVMRVHLYECDTDHTNHTNQCALILSWTPNDTIQTNANSIIDDQLFLSDKQTSYLWQRNDWRSLQSLNQCETNGLITDASITKKYNNNNETKSSLNIKLVERSQSCGTTPLKSVSNENSILPFNVDLNQMKSLRLFFSVDYDFDPYNDSTNGQLVIVNRESHYKVFHFHYGGLDKLANVLNEWHAFDKTNCFSEHTNYMQFSICKPQLKSEECHPEEDLYVTLNDNQWQSYTNEFGQILNEITVRKIIYFAGIEPSLRKEVWPFLVKRFEFNSTFNQRLLDSKEKYEQYRSIGEKLESLGDTEKELFWRNIQSIVEKDVIRTDRNNPYFAGENNDNIEKMKRILLYYAIYCPQVGYTQGMSDLLAPLLTEIQCEVETFWCFVGMLQQTNFVCSPRDADIDLNLVMLRELLRLMFPLFYAHIKKFPNDLELLFTHRWILLCFKREFNECDALRIWESCWSHYQTNYFHLFVCLSIISIYGNDVIRHNMGTDEILFHFSTLSMHMDANLILRKARGLFYQFCLLAKIPCTLQKLKNLCCLDMWDSDYEQHIECVQHLPTIAHLCSCNNEIIE